MSRFFISTVIFILFLASMPARAADAQALDILTKALTCNIKSGQTAAVIKAIKSLHAKPGKEDNTYILPDPIKIFGLNVNQVVVLPDDGEGTDVYIAIFPNGNLKNIAAAANLKQLGRDFSRDTKLGQLEATAGNPTEVSLSCDLF